MISFNLPQTSNCYVEFPVKILAKASHDKNTMKLAVNKHFDTEKSLPIFTAVSD